MLLISDQRRSWGLVGEADKVFVRIYIYICVYISRVDKEELEVVKWIWPSLEKERT